MASIPCSIHGELSSASSSFPAATATAPRSRLPPPSSSPSPFLCLAKTPGWLPSFSSAADAGGGGRLVKVRHRGIFCSLDHWQAAPLRNAGRGRRAFAVVNDEGPAGEGDAGGPAGAGEAKRPGLTAREKLRAARVLSKYAESKSPAAAPPPPPRRKAAEFGSKVLEAMRETDGGKRSGLPEAPSNMLDDRQRGLSTGGFSFDFAGSNDVLLIAFSFVFISTIMLATTFFVWKLGAIHFNEY